MAAYILDTETNDKENAEAIEVAWINLSNGQKFSQRYRPSKPITFGAMATHNIIMEDLVHCEPSGTFRLPADCSHMIGHNIEFDYNVIGRPEGVRLIDTLLLSRVVFDDQDSHTQLACLYRIDARLAQSLARGAHGALADVEMNWHLFNVICDRLDTTDMDVLHDLSEMAKIPATIGFGKYAGAKFCDIPADYKSWYMRQADTDPMVVAAMRGAEPLTLDKARQIVSEYPSGIRLAPR
jgi:exodeoxyribonuclease X